jgi:phosphonate transport system substrate-binding protein
MLLAAAPVRAQHEAASGGAYVFARAPQLSALTIRRVWQPLIDHLSKATGATVLLKVYSDRDGFERDLAEGTPDLVYGNLGYMVVGNELHGYVPLVRSDRSRLKGILVVRRDSPAGSVADLAGARIAFPAESAFAASLALRHALVTDQGLDFEPVYVGSHDNVYRNVASGRFAAGGGVYRTLNQEAQELRGTLRVLYETGEFAPHPIMAHPRVPPHVRAAVANAVLALESTEEGRAMLDRLKIKDPVRALYDRDYLPIRDFSLRMYGALVARARQGLQ